MANFQFNISKLLEQIVTGENIEIDLDALFEEKIKEYNISRRKAGELLNIDQRTLTDTLNGRAKQPSIINIIKIANFLEIDDLYKAIPAALKNQETDNIGSIERASDASFVAKNFDIKKLTQAGFFSKEADTPELIKRILSFFGYTSIFDYNRAINNPLLFSKTKRSFSDRMKDFWIKSAIQCFKSINNPNKYNRETLKELVQKIRPYCQDEKEGLFTVCKALYNVGVTVIFQNHLTLTQVRGGTFIVDGRPCIVITDLHKRYTTIWETLIHELSHVLFDWDVIATEGYHLTGEPDLLLIEEKAEEFTREYFCGYEEYIYIKEHIRNPFIIGRFAKEQEIHPSFVYSSYRQFEKLINGENYYHLFNEYFPDYSVAVKGLSPVTWKENSIQEIAQNLKTIFELNV